MCVCVCLCVRACMHVGMYGRGYLWDGIESGSWCGLCVKHQEHHIDP